MIEPSSGNPFPGIYLYGIINNFLLLEKLGGSNLQLQVTQGIRFICASFFYLLIWMGYSIWWSRVQIDLGLLRFLGAEFFGNYSKVGGKR